MVLNNIPKVIINIWELIKFWLDLWKLNYMWLWVFVVEIIISNHGFWKHSLNVKLDVPTW